MRSMALGYLVYWSFVWFGFACLFVLVCYVGSVPLVEQIVQVSGRSLSGVAEGVLCGHLFSRCVKIC